MTQYQQTDQLNDRAWRVSHDTAPQPEPRKRVRPRPHKRYEHPAEMWDWHWVRMRVVLSWVFVGTVCTVVLTAGIIICGEFW